LKTPDSVEKFLVAELGTMPDFAIVDGKSGIESVTKKDSVVRKGKVAQLRDPFFAEGNAVLGGDMKNYCAFYAFQNQKWLPLLNEDTDNKR
jgi:hypothetical protein